MLSGAQLFDSRPRRADRGSGSKYRRAVGSCGRRRYIGMVQEREGNAETNFHYPGRAEGGIRLTEPNHEGITMEQRCTERGPARYVDVTSQRYIKE